MQQPDAEVRDAERERVAPNASGTASDVISRAPIAVSRTTRVAPSSEAAEFESQAYETQAHQSAARIASPSTSRGQLGCALMKPVTCVIAKTSTRSKNSSSGVTCCSGCSAAT